jgi:two-component system, sensor histidine kinase RpfC
MIRRLKSMWKSHTPELEIIKNRFVIGFCALASYAYINLGPLILSLCVGFILINCGLYMMQKYSIMKSEHRWVFAILLDAFMGGILMYLAPEVNSFAPIILLWMILGNGFRFGLKYLVLASLLSTMIFAYIFFTAAYWQQNTVVGYGMLFGLVALPAYCSTLVRKMSDAKDQAEAANKAKSYFLASVSHELRTPLNAILGYGNHLRQMEMPRKQHEMIEASVLAADHLLHLIEQLIHVAKTETGKSLIETSKFKATDLISEVRDILLVRAQDKGIQLRIQAQALSDSQIEGPAKIIRNILMNLVGNAIKFTESGTVSIRASLVNEPQNTYLKLSVSDTGIGIAENAIQKIFQPFQQADESVLNRFGGTGLGLAICKQMTEQTNGTISVNSKLGKGSEFEVIIPVEIVSNTEQTALALESVQILSLGAHEPDLVESTQPESSFELKHIFCNNPASLEMALSTINIGAYAIALIDQNLAMQIHPDDPIWKRFEHAQVAPVLVSNTDQIEFDDISLRAEFASVLPASANFAELRSAIRIGCSFAKPATRDDESENKKAKLYTPRNILIADDNRTNRNVLAAILETAGHIITMATDGDEALDALEDRPFDILLLDVNMPRLNGIEACSMWRQIEGRGAHMPIIGVTADATAETESRCLAAGMDTRLTKPIDAKLLLSTIEKYTENSNLQIPEMQNYAQASNIKKLHGFKETIEPELDMAQLNYLKSIGNDRFLQEMIDSFFEDINDVITPLAQSVKEQNVQQFRFYAHAIKSSSNNIGALKLVALSEKLERATEADILEFGTEYLVEVEKKLALVKQELVLMASNLNIANIA